jgi:hypothetical protein
MKPRTWSGFTADGKGSGKDEVLTPEFDSLSRLSFHDVQLHAQKERWRRATAADQLVLTNQRPSRPS